MESLKEIELDTGRSRGNLMKKKIIIIIMCILIVNIIGVFIIKCLSYHENIDYSTVKKIQYEQYIGEYKTFEYINAEEIKRISQKIQHLNFYRAKEERLQESPTALIRIVYKDNSVKKISIAGMTVLITETRNNQSIKRDKCIYYVNAMKIKAMFK